MGPPQARSAARVVVLAALPLLTVVAGCGGGAPPAPASVTTAPAATPTAERTQGRAMRFVPRSFSCRPHRPADLAGRWQTYAARDPVRAGQPVVLGVRDLAGAGSAVLEAVVIGPRGSASARTRLSGTRWATVRFPQDFRASGRTVRSYGPGVYTVVWRTAGTPAKFISCDGFAANRSR